MSDKQTSSYRFALYVRKSSESEDRQVLSIESQVEHLKDYAKKQGFTIYKVYQDSASAHKPHNRPQFSQMMKDIKRKKINGVLSWKADRLARNLIEGGQIIHILQTQILEAIVTPHQSYFPQSNMLLLTIEFGMANQYSLDLSKNIRRGNRTKTLQGGWCHAAPTGYLNNRIHKTIIKDPQRFDHVKKMFQLYLTGNYSLADICNISRNQWDFKTLKHKKRGGRYLLEATLYKILKNPFYAGWVCTSGIVAKGNHDPMISQADFDEIQVLLSKNNHSQYINTHALSFPYKNLMTCSGCGGVITVQKKTKYNCPKCNQQHCSRYPKRCSCGHIITQEIIDKGKNYVYYHCTKKKGRSKENWTPCKQPYVNQKTIENQLIKYVEKLTPFHEPFTTWVSQCLKKVAENSEESKAIYNLQQKLQEVNQKEQNLLELAVDRLISSSEFKKKKLALESNKESLKNQIKKFKKDTLHLDVEKICKRLKHLGEEFKNLPPERKKSFLKKIGSNYKLQGKNLVIDWHPAIKTLLTLHLVYKGRIELLVCHSGTSLEPSFEGGGCLWSTKCKELRTHLQDFELPDFGLSELQ